MRAPPLACVAALCLSFTPKAGAVPKSLFVQVTSVPAGAEAYRTRTWFKKICDNHRSVGSPNYIQDLVLSEVADQNGTLDAARLSIVEDYFGCFDNVFVGTANLDHADPYVAGMKDSTFRWDNILLSEKIAQAYDARFQQKFPGQAFHWYVSYEANLNAFSLDTTLKNAYAAYLLELSNRLTAVRAGSVLWSPAFWTQYAAVSDQTALRSAIADVMAAAPKVNWLHFQDFVGQAAKQNCSTAAVTYGFNASDGIGYYNLINQAVGSKLASLRVNMEHFVSGGAGCPSGGLYPGESTELSARENAYQTAGVPIGASWEVRWWYRALYGMEDATCNQAEVCNSTDDNCDLKVDEGGVCGGTGGSATGGVAGNATGGGSGSPGSGGTAGGSAGSSSAGAAATGATNAGRASDDGGCGCTIAPSSTFRLLRWCAMLLGLVLRRKLWR